MSTPTVTPEIMATEVRITLNREQLISALIEAERYAASRAAMPILTTVKLTPKALSQTSTNVVQETVLRLESTDLDLFYSVEIAATGYEENIVDETENGCSTRLDDDGSHAVCVAPTQLLKLLKSLKTATTVDFVFGKRTSVARYRLPDGEFACPEHSHKTVTIENETRLCKERTYDRLGGVTGTCGQELVNEWLEQTVQVKHTFTLIAGKSKYTLDASIHAQDFPLCKAEAPVWVELGAKLYTEMYALASPTVSDDTTKPQLCSLFFERDGENLRFASTDGHRMTVIDRPHAPLAGFPESVAMPAKFALEVNRLAKELSPTAKSKKIITPHPLRLAIQPKPAKKKGAVGYEDETRIVDNEATGFVGGWLQVQTPAGGVLAVEIKALAAPYRAISLMQPGITLRSVVFPSRELLIETLARLLLVSSAKTAGMKFTFSKENTVTISADNNDGASGSEELPVHNSLQNAEVFSLGFNGRYFLESLKQMTHESVILELHLHALTDELVTVQGNRAVQILTSDGVCFHDLDPVQLRQGTDRFVIMPMRL